MKDDGRISVVCPICDSNQSKPERRLNDYDLVHCFHCGHIYVNPQPSTAELERIYKNHDSTHLIELYSRIAAPSVISEYQRTLACLEKTLPGRGRLLDFACAAGYFFEQAQKRGWDAHGTDLGDWTAAAAKARGLQNLRVGRLSDLHYPDDHFDVIYAAQVFEHLPRPLDDLAELRRILRPGGLLYIDVPNYHTLPIWLGKDDFMLNTPPQHINYFTPKTLHRLVKSGGFSQIQTRSSGGLKWENLLGKPIRSDILEAYQRTAEAPSSRHPAAAHQRSSKLGTLKTFAKTAFVTPVCYNFLKVGMKLIVTARR